MFADLILYNGKITIVDKGFSFHETVAVKNGWIMEIGDNQATRTLVGPETKLIDLEGKLLLPGAHDARSHVGCGWRTAFMA